MRVGYYLEYPKRCLPMAWRKHLRTKHFGADRRTTARIRAPVLIIMNSLSIVLEGSTTQHYSMPKQQRPERKRPVSVSRSTLKSANSAPAAVSGRRRFSRPVWSIQGDRFTVEHREFVNTVNSDVNNVFAYDVYPLDAANADSFPWLAGIAQNFEDFRLESFEAEYVTEIGTTSSGSVIMSCDYDAHDASLFETRQSLLQIEDSIVAPLWENVKFVASKHNLSKLSKDRYVASAEDEKSQNRLTSFGTLYIATTPTNLMTSTVNPSPSIVLGDLFFKYRISFATPQLPVALYTSGNALARPTAPQLTQKSNTTTANSTNGTNLLRGLADTIAILNDGAINPDAFGIQVVTALANQFLDPTSSSNPPVPAGEQVLLFTKDFEGLISTVFSTLAGSPIFTSPPTTPSVQYFVPNTNFTTTLSARDKRAADTSVNVTQTQSFQSAPGSGAVNMEWMLKAFISAGSVVRFASLAAYVVNALGGVMETTINASPRKWSNYDLDRSRSTTARQGNMKRS